LEQQLTGNRLMLLLLRCDPRGRLESLDSPKASALILLTSRFPAFVATTWLPRLFVISWELMVRVLAIRSINPLKWLLLDSHRLKAL
jgi:hypothetical protein